MGYAGVTRKMANYMQMDELSCLEGEMEDDVTYLVQLHAAARLRGMRDRKTTGRACDETRQDRSPVRVSRSQAGRAGRRAVECLGSRRAQTKEW